MTRRTETIPFVITYKPTLSNLTSVIRKNSNILYSSDRCKNVFKTLPLVAYRSCENITDILIRAQLTKTPCNNNSPVSFRFKSKNCTTCPYIEHGRNQYTFHSTGKSHKIKSHITCSTFNDIYMIQCKLCNLQYIGETKRRLKDRFNEHRRLILSPNSSYIHTAVSEHFLSNNHSHSHMLLIPIEKLVNQLDSFRKAREAHLTEKAQTTEPLGINKREG